MASKPPTHCKKRNKQRRKRRIKSHPRLLPFDPLSGNRLLVVLDLDHTLILSEMVSKGSPANGCDFIITNEEIKALGFPDAEDQRNVYIRPGLDVFLEQVSRLPAD